MHIEMKKQIVVSLLLLLCASMSAAVITGHVEDSNGQAIPFVTISLLTSDSTLITGTITDDNGDFKLTATTKVAIVRASYMGYETQCIDMTEQNENILIRLREETTALEEVVVMQRAPLVERHMDKIVMNVSSSPFAIGNNGKDILRKAPGVHIDRKGKITVNGKSVEVYIDGRPSYLSGEQLKAMLEGTDGATIDRVEILTQPSAKYDAEGQGGIINIKTKRNRSKGINGSVSAGYGGMYWRDLAQYMQEDHLSFGLNYRGESTYTSLMLTQQYKDRTETFESTMTTLEDKRQTYGHTRNRHQYYILKLSNDFMIDTTNTLGFIVSVPLSLSNGYGDKAHNYSTLYSGTTLLEQNSEELKTNNRWMQHMANINYTHVFSSALDQELTINLDYNRNNSLNTTNSTGEFLPSSATAYDLVIDQNVHHLTNLWSARADFQTNFWQTGKIESGAKWLTTQTRFHSATDTVSAGTLASDFTYTEHIAALYATAGKQFGEQWAAKLGLRGEYTFSQGQWQSADSTSRKSYFNLFPTAFVSYMPTEDWTISLDYARRIDRPTYTMLDPSIQYEDAHSSRIGNTELKPAFAHDLTFSVAYSEYVSLDYFFGHMRDMADYQVTVLPGGNRLSTAVNYGTSTMHGVFLSLTEIPLVPKFTNRDENGKRKINGAWLALTAQVGVGHETTQSYDGLFNNRQWVVDVSAELNAYLPHNWTVSVDGMYTSPSVWGMEKLSSWKEMNLAVKKDFPKLGLTLTARVSDLLLSTKWSSESIGLPDGYSNTFRGNDRMHAVTLGVNYKFGTTLEHRRHADLDDSRAAESSGRRHKR